MASKKSKPSAGKSAEDMQNQKAEPPDRPIKIDEYVDDKYDVRELDALDVPYALRSDSVLGDVADSSDGIEEIDVLSASDEETVDSGVRRHHTDDADMGLGAEAHSAEELEDAAIGDALPGRRGVTRDDEVHGKGFMDDIERAADELR
jgi:hypothetical protein